MSTGSRYRTAFGCRQSRTPRFAYRGGAPGTLRLWGGPPGLTKHLLPMGAPIPFRRTGGGGRTDVNWLAVSHGLRMPSVPHPTLRLWGGAPGDRCVDRMEHGRGGRAMKRDASWRSAALMVAIVAVGGCGIGCNDYVCAPVTITLADAETGEPVSDSEVVVAWVDALEGLEAESYLASHGEPVGATDDEGHIGVEICGHWVLVPYAPSEKFVLTHHVAILGVTRDTARCGGRGDHRVRRRNRNSWRCHPADERPACRSSKRFGPGQHSVR